MPGRTSGEYRQEIDAIGSETMTLAFGEATGIFERAWYGPDIAGPADLELLTHNETRVLAGEIETVGVAHG